MAIRDIAPVSPGDPAIEFGDTGDAVKVLQEFLQNDPEIRKEIELISDSRSSTGPFTLTDSNHSGKFEEDTKVALSSWQLIHEKEIKKAGGIDNLNKEFGRLGYATWRVISTSIGNKSTTSSPPQKPPLPSPLKDPKSASKAKNSTHYVKTKDPKSKLALRESPSFVAVSKDAWKDKDKKGKLVLMMENEVLLKVIEPHVGFQCEWHRVEVVDPDSKLDKAKKRQEQIPLYAFAEFVQPLTSTPELLPINCLDCDERIRDGIFTSAATKEWHKLSKCEPFFDECFYHTTVETSDLRTTTSLLPQQKKRAMRQGVEQLLEFYDKQRDTTFVDRLMKSFEFAIIDDDAWNIDIRPGSKLKFLVKIPAKYFDAIPPNTEFLDDLATIEGVLPKDWRTTHFQTNTLKAQIDAVVRRLEEYALDVDRWSGTVPINIREQIHRLRSFPSVLRDFVELNGFQYREDEEDTIEIGFEGPCFNLIYVLLNQGKKSIALRIGLECFKKKEPVKFQETMGYVFYLDDMVRDIKKSKKTWLEFLQTYTCPVPEISPSKRPSPQQTTPADQSRESDRIARGADCNSAKTEKDKSREDRIINDSDFKQRAALRREKEKEFVGDNVLSCESIPNMIDRISSLEDVYSEILNKVDISGVASFISSCIATQMDPKDVKKSAANTIFDGSSSEALDGVIAKLPSPYTEQIAGLITSAIETIPAGKPATIAEIKRRILKDLVPESILFDVIVSALGSEMDILIEKMSPLPPSCDDITNSLPNVPTVSLPDDLPTEDILGDIGPSIENAIRNALSGALISVAKDIFRMICNTCTDNQNLNETFGDANLNDIIGDTSPQDTGGARRSNIRDIGNDIFREFGIPEVNKNGSTISDFFDDISSILTPSEICRLLNGSASDDTLKAVRSLIENIYPELVEFLDSQSRVKELFSHLGTFVSPDVCDKIFDRTEKIPDELCNTDISNELRSSLLAGKMSPTQVKQQLEELKRQQREQLSQLARIVQGDILKGIIPPIVDSACSRRDSGRKGIIPRDPPSLDFLNDKVVGVMFDGVHMAFNSDISEYASALINLQTDEDTSELKESNEEFKKAHAAKFKNIEEIKESDTQALLKDPLADGTSRGEKVDVVAPEVLSLLTDVDNFGLVGSDEHTSKPEYLYRANFSNTLKRLEAIKGLLFKNQSEKELALKTTVNKLSTPGGFDIAEVSSLVSQVTTTQEDVDDRQRLIDEWVRRNTKTGEESLTEKPSPVCLTDELELNRLILELTKFANNNFIDDKKLIEYSIPSYGGDKTEFKDIYFIKIHDTKLDDPILLVQEDEVDDDVLDIVKNYKLKEADGASAQQEVFSEFTRLKWDAVITNDSKSNLKKNTPFHKFFRDTTFHRITNFFMDEVARQTSTSPLFSRNKLEKIEFVPLQNDEQDLLCAPTTTESKSLLDMDEIKRSVKEDYEKKIATCPPVELGDTVSDAVNEMEKAGLGGVVQSLIKVFVIDVFLRGLFVWAEFKMGDTLADGSINNFVLEKVKRDLQALGDDFYNKFAEEARDHLLDRGDRLIDPFAPDPTNLNLKEDEVLTDLDHPDTQSGEAAIEYLIKEQIGPISKKIEKLLGKPDIEDLEKLFIDQWLKQSNKTLETSAEIRAFLRSEGLDETGSLYLDKYVRVCRSGAKNGVIKSPDSSVKNDEQLSYGVRLVYLPPILAKGKDEKDPFKGISFRDEKRIRDEKSFILRGDQIEQLPDVVSIPLIQVEEDETRRGKLGEKEEEKMFESLKDKMRDTSEWKLLFRYCFPLKRFLVLNAIYNVMAVSTVVEDIDEVFERTKNELQSLQHTLLPADDGKPWWNKPSPQIEGQGGNVGIRAKRMGNITTSGPTPSLIRLAQSTIGILIKGMAEKYDPSYKLIKLLDDQGAAIAGLTWGSVPQVLPINIFGPFGFGPPLGPWGAMALGVPRLPGERKEEQRRKTASDLSKMSPEELNKACSEEEEE